MRKEPSNKFTQLSDLFSVYKQRLRPPQASVEQAAFLIITDVTGLPVPRESIVYTPTTRTLSIQVPSILKSEITFHFDAIQKRLQTELGVSFAPLRIR